MHVAMQLTEAANVESRTQRRHSRARLQLHGKKVVCLLHPETGVIVWRLPVAEATTRVIVIRPEVEQNKGGGGRPRHSESAHPRTQGFPSRATLQIAIGVA